MPLRAYPWKGVFRCPSCDTRYPIGMVVEHLEHEDDDQGAEEFLCSLCFNDKYRVETKVVLEEVNRHEARREVP